MYPPSIALPDELGEAYLPRLLHLLDELEQAAISPLPSSPLWEEFHTSREMSAFSYWQCFMFAAMIESSPLGELEGASSFVQLATPKAPAKAVSTAMITLRNLPQLKELVCEFISF